ncbi:hypothetical protein NG830_19325 [Pantoea ananatis]|uniref:hypothetical protein n=1 Tax=Pantoea TaxID=53335 RepID=UPI0012D87A6C|nr:MULTISPECIES: hypothetical protein [Pantoea]UYL01333.1 hypothetical protein NG830_19325 [Pantoea ananatis]
MPHLTSSAITNFFIRFRPKAKSINAITVAKRPEKDIAVFIFSGKTACANRTQG